MGIHPTLLARTSNPQKMIFCRACWQDKPESEFLKRPNGQFYRNCKSCRNTSAKAWQRQARKEGRINDREKNMRKYGITLAEYENMCRHQGYRCKICGTNDSGNPTGVFCVDHCHATLKVRGLLCRECNFALGKFKDNPLILMRAAQYLNGELE